MVMNINKETPVKEKYRLGDAARGNPGPIAAMALHVGSIGDLYVRMTMEFKRMLDWKALRRIALDHRIDHSPIANELVVHFRMGDRHIDSSNLDQFTASVLKAAEGKSFVTVVAGIHHHLPFHEGDGTKELSQLLKALQEKEIPVTVRSSQNPDDDFAYMIRANHLHTSVGSFSLIAALCCEGVVTFTGEGMQKAFNLYKNQAPLVFKETYSEIEEAVKAIWRRSYNPSAPHHAQL